MNYNVVTEESERSFSNIQKPQREAATLVGATYLLAMVTGIVSESIRGSVVVLNDAVMTAKNIQLHETLFRASIACDLLVPTIDLALIAALYVVLKPVNRNLALFAVLVRVVESTVGVVVTLNNFDALRLLSGASYLRVFESNRLQALARLAISAHGAGYNVMFFLLGVGSAVFAYLWLKSRYIPKAIAALGLLGSLLMALSALVIVVFPLVAEWISPWYMAPMGLFEISVGLWLLIKGLPGSGEGSAGSIDSPRKSQNQKLSAR